VGTIVVIAEALRPNCLAVGVELRQVGSVAILTNRIGWVVTRDTDIRLSFARSPMRRAKTR
jgi:hypothetical protein